MSEFSPEPAASAAVDESLAGGSGAGDVAPVEPTTPQEPAATSPVLEPALNPQEVQAELEYMRSAIAERDAILQQLASQQPNGTQPAPAAGFDASQLVDEFGNLNPAALGQMLDQRNQALLTVVQQQLQQIAAPLSQQMEAEKTAAGEARLSDILADDIARNGEFASDPQADAEARQLVRTLAEQEFGEVAARYGEGPRAAEIAMSRAADRVRGLLRAAGGAAQTEQANRLATLAGAAAEPGGGAMGTMNGKPEFKSPGDVTRHYAAVAAARRQQT